MNQEPNSEQLNDTLAEYILNQMNFEVASMSIAPSCLNKIHPSGRCASLNAFSEGCTVLSKLRQTLNESKIVSNWSIIHIFIVDSQDTASSLTLADTIKSIGILNQNKNGNMRIFIIGIDLPEQAQNAMKVIKKESGENASFVKLKQADISGQLSKILSDLKLKQRRDKIMKQSFDSRVQQSSGIKKMQRFAFIFNLPINQSMAGAKWKQVCEGVEKFKDLLVEVDILTCIVYNQQPRFLMKISHQDQIYKQPHVEVELNSSFHPHIQTEYKQNSNRKRSQKGIRQQDSGCNSCQLI